MPATSRDRSLSAIGYGLLAVWAYWWISSFQAGYLTGWSTWVPAYLELGRDFSHNFLAVHLLARGGNPYLQNFGDDRGRYAYPPIVLGLFLWCALFPPRMRFAATIVWTLAIASLIALGARFAWRQRRRWSAKDGPLVNTLLVPGLIYWQPLAIHLPMQWLLLFKLMALTALAICLVRRIVRA